MNLTISSVSASQVLSMSGQMTISVLAERGKRFVYSILIIEDDSAQCVHASFNGIRIWIRMFSMS